MRGFRGLAFVCLLVAATVVAAAPALASNPLLLDGSTASPCADSSSPAHGLLYSDEAGRVHGASSDGSIVEIEIAGVVARARVTQLFSNPTERWLDATYVFPLPDGAAVDALRLVVGERVIEGQIDEREAAEQTFEQARAEGRKASLLEQNLANVFTTSVANIGPGERVEVTIELQARVRYDGGTFRFTFPTFVAPRYAPSVTIVDPALTGGDARALTGFSIELDAGLPLARLESPTHAIVSAPDGPGRHRVQLAAGVEAADRDFVLEWKPAAGSEPTGAVYVEDLDGERYVLAVLVPPEATERGPRLAREMILVLDTSGSMSGHALEGAKQALLAALDSLEPADSFNVLRFSDEVEQIFAAPEPASEDNLELARAMVSSLATNGGTNIHKALVAALAMQGTPSALRQVVFLSDGLSGGEKAMLELVTRHLGTARLFPVAIGSAPNHYLLRKAAELGRGSLTQISAPAEVAQKSAALIARLESPALSDLALEWGAAGAEVYPTRAPDLYRGEPVVLVARVPPETARLELSGLNEDGPWTRALLLGGRERESFGGIAKLWARAKVESLLDDRALGADAEDIRRQIVELALRFGLVTDFTSLVAVDDHVSAPERAPEQEASFAGGDGVAETITVTSSSPLLDARRISTSTTVSRAELHTIPTARDPWAVLAQTPGITVSRADVGLRAGSGKSTWLSSGGCLDGVVIENLSAIGTAPSYYDFSSFEELEVTNGGTDVTVATPEPQLNVITARGTNTARASGSLRDIDETLVDGAAANDTGASGDRLTSELNGEAEGGGPLRQDRLWLWGLLHATERERQATGGLRETEQVLSGAVKLNAQLTGSASLAMQALAAESDVLGAGADPRRTPESLVNAETRDRGLRVEGTHVVSPNLYWRLAFLGTAAHGFSSPVSGEAIAIDDAGLARGGDFGRSQEPTTNTLWTEMKRYTGDVASQEIALGASLGDERHELGWRAPEGGWLVHAGAPFGLTGTRAIAERWSDGRLDLRQRKASAWLQDQLTFSRLTLTGGLRFDHERLRFLPRSLDASGTAEQTFDALSPRLAATWALTSERTVLLRAGLGRYASWNALGLATRLAPGAPSAELFFFDDLDGDLGVDDAERGSLVPWVLARGEPGSPFWRAGAVAADLDAERDDEASLGLELEPRPGFALALRAVYRQRSELFEERLLVSDAGGGAVRVATREDWRPIGTIGASTVWDLADDLTPVGVRLVNGDRELETLLLSLSWHRRLSGSWMTRGHVSWSRVRRHLGPDFLTHDDPTPGLFDNERGTAAEPRLESPFGVRSFSGGRWSFHAGVSYRFAAGLDLGVGASGREGDPLPAFRRVARPIAGPTEVPLADRLDDEHAEAQIQLDVRLARELTLGEWVLTPSLEVFNLLDERPALRRELDQGLTRAGAIDESAPPRTVRVGLRVEWN